MAIRTCPTAELERLLVGGLPEREAELLEQHVLDCPSCLASLKKLFHSQDTISGILSDQTHVDTFAASPMVDDLIRKLATLRSVHSHCAQEGSPMLTFSCCACGEAISVEAAAAGTQVSCPHCGRLQAAAALVAAGAQASVPMQVPVEEASLPSTQPPRSLDATEEYTPAHSSRDALTDFLAPPQAADELGRLGDYRILKVLGHGGMGVVYLAEDIKLKRGVAIKAMLPTLAVSASAGQRFRREAQSMAALEHDHIVRIYQVDEDRGIPYLAMEFLKGETLDERLKRDGKLPVADVVRIGREIAEALGAAHASGLIHRDIKPGNIWLEAPRSRVKILDFGLARAASQDAGLTQQGAIVGTPAYMSPEQARGASTIDARCDLFSLGVVLYRLCTGQQPFRGGDNMSTLMEVAMRDPPPPCQLNAEVPPDLSDLVMNLLEKDPDRRTGSAAEVVKALAKLDRQLATAQAPEEQTAVMPAVEPATAVAPRRRRWLPALIVALALVGGLFGAWAAGLIRIHTDEGDFVIKTDNPEFAFSVGKDGGITLEDRKTNRTYQVKKVREDKRKSEVELEVTDADAHLSFKTKTFTIKRGEMVALQAWFERKETIEPKPTPEGKNPSNVAKANSPALLEAPFTKEQADKARAEWAAYLKVPERKQLALPKGVKLELVLIPPGQFHMGDMRNSEHDVTITKPFYMAVTETTQEQYEAVAGNNPSGFSANGDKKEKLAPGMDTSRFPVDHVNWPDAEAFGKKIGAQLPTEAQWEYACRAGTTTKYHFGEAIDGTEANVKETGLERTTTVASYAANAFGLYDMHGNVREWCRDWYGEKTDDLEAKDPERTIKQSGDVRLLRGGSWSVVAATCRAAYRFHDDPPDSRKHSNGFRVIVSLPMDTVQVDPDRQAMELLHPYYDIWVRFGDGRRLEIKKSDPAPAGAFVVEEILFADYPKLTPDFKTQILLLAVLPLKSLQKLKLGADPSRPLLNEGDVARLAAAPFASQLLELNARFELTATTINAIKQLPRLIGLGCLANKAVDADLAGLKDLQLKSLHIGGLGQSGRVGQKGYQALAAMPLSRLILAKPRGLNAPAIQCFAAMPALKGLDLREAELVDDLLRDIAKLPRLDRLDLEKNEELTDSGLAHLTAMKTLKWLAVWDCPEVTRAGAMKLSVALPRCEINSSFGKFGPKIRPPALLQAPFTKEQAGQTRAEWAKYEEIPERKQLDLGKGVKLDLVLIPPGQFRMGTEGNNADELAHDVTITKPFYMAVTETTQEQYEAVVGTNPSGFSSKGNKKQTLAPGTDTAKFPVERVNWFEAESFGKEIGARLPTEAQWEYACRAGTTTNYHFGEAIEATKANIKETNLGRTTKVASYAANAFGLYDMHGNVREWCRDWYGEKTADLGANDPERTIKQSDDLRVQRGGGWSTIAAGCRAAYRDRYSTPINRHDGSGFRVIVDLP